MNILPEAELLIRHFEKSKLKAYRDRSGRWTIGFGWQGWTGEPVPTEGMTITQKQADELFDRALAEFRVNLDIILKVEGVELEDDWQYGGLLSLVYNKGPTIFRASEILVHLKRKEVEYHMADAGYAFTHRTMLVHPDTGQGIPRLDWSPDETLGLDEYGKPRERWFLGLAKRRRCEAAFFDGMIGWTNTRGSG